MFFKYNDIHQINIIKVHGRIFLSADFSLQNAKGHDSLVRVSFLTMAPLTVTNISNIFHFKNPQISIIYVIFHR